MFWKSTTKKEDQLERFRKKLSSSQVQELINELSSRINNNGIFAGRIDTTNAGTSNYFVTSAITFLGYDGWAIPTALNITNAGGVVATYMLGAALTAGLDKDASSEKILLAGSIGSVAGGLSGILLGTGDVDFAEARVIQATSFFETFAGLGLGIYADIDAQGPRYIGMALGNIGGAVSARIFSQKQSYSVGDAIMLSNSAFVFGIIPMSIMSVFGRNYQDSWAVYGFGTLAGIAMNHMLTRDIDYTKGKALWVSMFTAGGGIGGLLFAAPAGDGELVTLASSLGLGLGLFISSRSFTKRLKHKSLILENAIDFQLNPNGIMSIYKPTNDIQTQMNNPLMKLSFRF
ncbi:MAG: hypothetical protein ACI8ZO_000997 [Flavobacteriales bacterium]|jgi:uncharacterized protein YneF (UPF0154 family)